ncbi:Ger(x)C family spore germination protein [Paenibacillus rhizoplanae]|uniref:Ger(X)C family spore germination protein n=1 Tax=Paenibacillus rhizoplanae TaxID=1917181 RepID=A0ABW5FH13_9BACL
MRRVSIFFMTALCLLLITGCWNRRELNDLALVVAMSIDKSDDQYMVTLQVVDAGEVSSKIGTSGRTPVITYSEKGKHVFEAIRKMTTGTPRKLYFSHLQMLVISEDIAKEGISKSLEFLSRDHEVRKDFFVVIAKEEQAKSILENITSLEKIPAQKMKTSLETSQKVWAPTVAIQIDQLIADLTSEGSNAVLTGIIITGNPTTGTTLKNVTKTSSYSNLKFQGVAVFKKDKLVGWLNEEESKGYNYIKDNVKSTVAHIECPGGGDLVMEVLRSKTKVKGKVVNGEPSIDIHLSAEINIAEVECPIDLSKIENIIELEQSINEKAISVLEASIRKAKELGSDIFGFGEVIHRADPQAWKTWKTDWNKHFAETAVTIHSDFKIRRTGIVSNSFLDKVKE